MRICKALRRILSLLAAMSLLTTAAVASPFKAKINSPTAQVYARPSEDAASVKGLENLTVAVTAHKNGWAQVRYKGRLGYIQIKDLDLSAPVEAYALEQAQVYAQIDGASMGTLKKGAMVYVIGMDGDYCRVQNSTATLTGYILAQHLTSQKPEAASMNNGKVSSLPSGLSSTTASLSSDMDATARLEYAIYLAQNQMGKPCKRDPLAPSSFDDVSLMQYCYGGADFSMEGTEDYRRVRYGELRRGDMVCFNTDARNDDYCDHFGIYLGEGYFIHASGSAGRVIVTSMESDSHYRNVFSWGYRIG